MNPRTLSQWIQCLGQEHSDWEPARVRSQAVVFHRAMKAYDKEVGHSERRYRRLTCSYHAWSGELHFL